MSRAARRRAGPALTLGTIVAGRFRIEDKLGEGGMAEVFRAEDIATARRVAVKVLHPEIATNPEAVERTKREGQVLSGLDNPAIVSVETFGQLEDGTVFLVMELLEGETLGERMRRGPLDAPELAPVVAGTCAGLHAAHAKGIVHRDLKPDNIFLCPTEHGLQVKLLDFGISKVYGGEKLTQTGEILGTPRYMSPEQLGAEPDIDARVDVYALGVILYEALAGKPPFLATTPTDLIIAILNGKVTPLRSARPDAPAAVEAVVMRAISKVRAARFDTAMELATAYVDAVGGVSTVRGQQRRGMATRAFGGARQGISSIPPPMDALPNTRPPPAPVGKDSLAGNLRLGTFSGMITASPSASPAGGSPPPRSIPPTSADELPFTRESPMSDPDAAEAPRRIAATAMMEASHPMMQAPTPSMAPSPSSSRRRAAPPPARPISKVLLVLGALIAGAASAAAVIAGMHAYRASQDEPADAVESATPTEVTSAEVTPPEITAPEEVPTPDGIEPPPLEETASETAATDGETPAEGSGATTPPEQAPASRRGGSGRRSGGGESSSTDEPDDTDATHDGPPVLPGFGDTGHTQPTDSPASADPLRAAREALRAGEPQRCVQILDDAIRGGAPAIALRRRGDCHEAAGNRAAAIQDYQRFCRLVPDHPTISELRPLLESWGRSCP
jgi:serine/threonine-protein kinase